MMTTVVLAEYPEDAVKATGLIQKDAQLEEAQPRYRRKLATPQEPALEESADVAVVDDAAEQPVVANADAEGPGVAALRALASTHADLSTENHGKAKEMNTAENAAEVKANEARAKAEAAGVASISHTEAEDQHKEAKELALEASIAQQKSLKATAVADAAKKKLDELEAIMNNYQSESSRRKQEMKRAAVIEEAKLMAVNRLKDGKAKAEIHKAETEAAKKASDSRLVLAKREKMLAEEALGKIEAAAKEAKDLWMEADQKAQQASKDASAAMQEESRLSVALGKQQAETAKAEVREAVAEKARGLAQDYSYQMTAESHDALEDATKYEAQAAAAVVEANRLGSHADVLGGDASKEIHTYLPNGSPQLGANGPAAATSDIVAPGIDATIEVPE